MKRNTYHLTESIPQFLEEKYIKDMFISSIFPARVVVREGFGPSRKGRDRKTSRHDSPVGPRVVPTWSPAKRSTDRVPGTPLWTASDL